MSINLTINVSCFNIIFKSGKRKYKLKWKGFDEESWEFEENLNCSELLAEFLAKKENSTNSVDANSDGSIPLSETPASLNHKDIIDTQNTANDVDNNTNECQVMDGLSGDACDSVV
jgi:hypothetical protein